MAGENASPELLEQFHYFATPVYTTRQPQFLDDVRGAALSGLKKTHGAKKPDRLYPVRMSESLFGDERIAPFAEFVGNTAWNILAGQGHAMGAYSTSFTELWCQEHFYSSAMDYHAHGGGNFIVGFFFLDVPEGAPALVFHDPRPSRLMLELPQTDATMATLASTMVHFKPEPGLLVFAPAWLPHSIGRNASKEPFRFIHFNLTVNNVPPQSHAPAAEVV